jgi:hypothetical protein
MGSEPVVRLAGMLRSLARRLARDVLHRRLRRLGGTDTVAWAIHVPLVTLVVLAALAAAVIRTSPRN